MRNQRKSSAATRLAIFPITALALGCGGAQQTADAEPVDPDPHVLSPAQEADVLEPAATHPHHGPAEPDPALMTDQDGTDADGAGTVDPDPAPDPDGSPQP